jgi:NADPH:quinone reductase-like Zn-dependent oxidoreductase
MKKILLQLDPDPQPSVFDRVVAVDAGVDFLFTHAAVKPEQVQGLVHGAIFTRHPDELKNTAIFVGGSDAGAAEKLVAEALKSMIPPANLRVSILMDANGCNTTAAAAVLAARQHLPLKGVQALVLGATGPVGQRVVRLLAREGARVRVGSRKAAKAVETCGHILAKAPHAQLEPVSTDTAVELAAALHDQQLVIAAGAAGAVVLPENVRKVCGSLKVVIDLNAVPPLGIEGVKATDKAKGRDGLTCYGALGVGGTKMKIHKAAIAKLFERNDLVMDAEEVYQLGQALA